MNVYCPAGWTGTHLTVCLPLCWSSSERRGTAIQSETPCSVDLWDELFKLLWPPPALKLVVWRTQITHLLAKRQPKHTTSTVTRETLSIWKYSLQTDSRSNLTWWRFNWDQIVYWVNCSLRFASIIFPTRETFSHNLFIYYMFSFNVYHIPVILKQ